MPHPSIHEHVDKCVFGRSYPHVHKWIDGTFDGTNGRRHWIARHHIKAIDEHFESDIEKKVARLHVMVDWLFYYKMFLLPRNELEVKGYLRLFGVWTP